MDVQPGEADQAVGSEQRAKAQEFKNSGNEKFNKSNYKGAIVDYQKGLLHELKNPDLHANLSAAYLHLEMYIEAKDHARFAIHCRPNFYKGYMRAAKADHGKGRTRLALEMLAQGLSNVTDPNGLKELNRLKNQYTAYLSLQSNNEREMEFDSDVVKRLRMDVQPGEADQAVGSEQRAKAQEFKNSGNEKFNKSNYKGAIVDYQKVQSNNEREMEFDSDSVMEEGAVVTWWQGVLSYLHPALLWYWITGPHSWIYRAYRNIKSVLDAEKVINLRQTDNTGHPANILIEADYSLLNED